ncbi:MAG TPA: hypothetical protein VFT22_02990 [Kofleriaceae bacterium]|nr:hypothetical protein [Kofleriaceae bacterium]
MSHPAVTTHIEDMTYDLGRSARRTWGHGCGAIAVGCGDGEPSELAHTLAAAYRPRTQKREAV